MNTLKLSAYEPSSVVRLHTKMPPAISNLRE